MTQEATQALARLDREVPADAYLMRMLLTLEHHAALDPIGLDLDPELPVDLYEDIGRALGLIRDMSAWALGDWLLFGERAYGEDRWAQAIEVTGRSKATLQNYLRVALSLPRKSKRRYATLSWSHHEAVASLPPAEQRRLLAMAVKKGWSVEELRGMRKTETDDGDDGDQQVMPQALPSVEDAAKAVLTKAKRVQGGWLVPLGVMTTLREVVGGADA